MNMHNLIVSILRLRNPEQTNKISCLYCKILATIKSGQIPRNNFFFLNLRPVTEINIEKQDHLEISPC